MICPQCSEEVPEGSAFCNHCGVRLEAEQQPARGDACRPDEQAFEALTPVQEEEGQVDEAPPESEAASVPEVEVELEKPVWRGTPSIKSMSGRLIVAGLTFLIIIFLAAYFSHKLTDDSSKKTLWIVACALLLGLAAYNLYKVVKLKTTIRYRLTTERILIEQGLLGKLWNEIELARVKDVTVHQKVLDRMFGVGTVRVLSSDASEPILEMTGIANALEVKELVREHVLRMRQREGTLDEEE